MTTLSNRRAELKVPYRKEGEREERKGEMKSLGGRCVADDVYVRADCWKSTYKVIDMKMKETPLTTEPSADFGKRGDFNYQRLHVTNMFNVRSHKIFQFSSVRLEIHVKDGSSHWALVKFSMLNLSYRETTLVQKQLCHSGKIRVKALTLKW